MSKHFVGFNSVCPIADHDMLTVGRSARNLLCKKNGTSAAWSKKKTCLSGETPQAFIVVEEFVFAVRCLRAT